jgi:hypothetical protein
MVYHVYVIWVFHSAFDEDNTLSRNVGTILVYQTNVASIPENCNFMPFLRCTFPYFCWGYGLLGCDAVLSLSVDTSVSEERAAYILRVYATTQQITL